MSREASGLRLSLDSPARQELPLREISGKRCWFRYGLLLLTVFAGIWGASVLRPSPTDLVAIVAADFTTFQAATGVLVASLIAVAFLGCLRRVIENHRNGQKATKRRVLSVRREPSAIVWRAQEDERKHLSRELHDSVGQLLTGVGLQLRALRSTPLPPDQMRDQLDEACRLNAEALRQVRDLAMGLRPALLDDVSLITALEWQTRQFSRQAGISASLEANGEIDSLPETHRSCIYRCVQEALTNCAKHAQAKNIRIIVRTSASTVNVVIEDDGIGFDATKSARGLGLLGMRERVAGVNGSLSVTSRTQWGTALSLEIPLPGSVLA
jgi:signal transduction histidine kinase